MKKRLPSLIKDNLISLAVIFVCTAVLQLHYVQKKQVADGIVTFDTARYLNARRASMIELLGKAQAGDKDVNPMAVVGHIDKIARVTIERIADGRLVVVKQALALDKQVPDITDDVIKALNLPDVKTTINADVENMANNYSTSDFYERAKKVQALINKEASSRAHDIGEQAVEAQNKELIP